MVIAKACLFVIVAVLLVEGLNALSLDCPPSSKMTNCSPKCKDDTECFGQKCCPNICNAKSCLAANQHSSSSNGYKSSSNSATGVYCGNVKCSSFQKCEIDRNTKRQRCV